MVMRSFPSKVTKGVEEFLEKKILHLKKSEKELKSNDPFFHPERDSNGPEEDLDEQIDHFENTVKVNFIHKQIIQIRKALSRLRIGKYGVCERCGKMIDTDRLAVKPESTLCIDCAKESGE